MRPGTYSLLFLAASAISLRAQQQPIAVTVTGFVSDSAGGRPLSGASVELRSSSVARVIQSDASGGFRFRQVEANTYHLSVRRIGYAEWTRDVAITRDTTLTINLASAVQLDTTRVGARFVGIYGMVGESHTLHAVAGATLTAIGSGKTVTSDSTGAFAIETPKGGSFVLRITRDGYVEQRVAVTVPPNDRVEIAPLLDTTSEKAQTNREYVWKDFDKRVVFRGPGSTLLPADELTRYEGGSLTDNIVSSPSFVKRSLTLGPTICLFINGQPKPGWPLDAIDVSRVLAIELYVAGPRGDATGILGMEWPPGQRCSTTSSVVNRGKRSTDVVYAVIWLKP